MMSEGELGRNRGGGIRLWLRSAVSMPDIPDASVRAIRPRGSPKQGIGAGDRPVWKARDQSGR